MCLSDKIDKHKELKITIFLGVSAHILLKVFFNE